MYLFFDENFPMIRRNEKNMTPAPSGMIMNVKNQDGALRTKNSEIAPRNATVITSKTLSTTREVYTFGIRSIVFVLEDENPYKIPQSGRDNKIDGLADKNAGS